MRAYFDNNIVVYIENGTLDLKALIQRIDERIDAIYFSSAHLHEAEEIRGATEEERDARIKKRITTLEEITKSNFLYQDLENNVFYQVQEPSTVLATIREVPFGTQMMKGVANFVSEDQREIARTSIGVEASKLNNYTPKEVIDHLNKRLAEWGQGHSIVEIIELGVSLHPQGRTFGLSNRIAGVFELLDLVGYWKDKPSEKSNYARLWDSYHTYFAASCDYFVSDDKRTRNKARVVYGIYGIKTKVISSQGLP